VPRAIEEVCGLLDRHASERAESQQVAITRDDGLGTSRDGALENPVVRRVRDHDIELLCRCHTVGRRTDGRFSVAQVGIRPAELLPKNPERLVENGLRDGDVELALKPSPIWRSCIGLPPNWRAET